MTMTDYTLIATATATILLAPVWWWRRCSLQIRILVQENGWFLGSLWLVQYVWYEITIHGPFQIGMLGAFAALIVWFAGLLPVVTRRILRRLAAVPKAHPATATDQGPGTDPMPGLPKPRDRRRCGRATRGRAPHDRDHPPPRQRRGARLERNRRTHRQSGTRQSLPAVPGPNRNPNRLTP